MNIMTKRGQLDNIVTYEHFCDDVADLANIPQEQITLGSIAVALKDGNTEGLIVYIADSNKQWIPLIVGGSGGNTPTPISDIAHICTQDEYDSATGIPTVVLPIENTFYFVPAVDGETNNLFKEWIYVNGNWELFGSVDAPSGALQSDWEQTNSTSLDFIKNKPFGEIVLEYSEETDNFFVGQVVDNSEPDSNGNYWVSFNPNVYMSYLPNDWADYPAVYCILKLDNQTYTALLTLNTYNEEQYYSVNVVHPDTQSAIVDFDFSQDPNVPFALCLAKDSAQNISSIGRLILSRTINDNFWTGMTFKFAPVMIKKIDQKYLPNANWNVIDEDGAGYIKNKPFGEISSMSAPFSYGPFGNQSKTNDETGTEYNVAVSGVHYLTDWANAISNFGETNSLIARLTVNDTVYYPITLTKEVEVDSEYGDQGFYYEYQINQGSGASHADNASFNDLPIAIYVFVSDEGNVIEHGDVIFIKDMQAESITSCTLEIGSITIKKLNKKYLPEDIFNPATGDLTIEGTNLTLGSTTMSEAQLQTLLSLSDATGVGF